MFGIADYGAFVAAIVVFLLIPGPGNLALITSTGKGGLAGGMAATLGLIAGDQVLMWLAVAGVAALLAAYPAAFHAVQWVGAAYLAWLGLRMLRSKGGFKLPDADSAASVTAGESRRIFFKSFLVAVTNPKGYIFCSALLPQFIDPAAAQAPQYLIIALIFAGLDTLVMLGYAFVGARAIRVLTASATRWIDRACGGMLLALAGSLAFYRRSAA